MNQRIEENEIFSVLDDIERGRVQVLPSEDRNRYACTIEHKTSNGWTFWIFDDAGQWDYIEKVTHPDGRVLNPWEFLDSALAGAQHTSAWEKRKEHWTYAYEKLRDYRPDNLDRWPGWEAQYQ